MKNFLFILLLLFAMPKLMFAQKNAKIAKGLKSLEAVALKVMPAQNNESLMAAELDRRGPGIAPKFATHMEVNINPTTDGTWETADNGNEVWRMRIHSAGAKSLNLGFTKYIMPPGGSLILYTPKRSEVLGPFTPADNEEHEQLWTPVVPGDELIIEVQVPPAEKENLQLELKSVNHDFVGFTEMSMLSGSCNLDVICGEADGWGIVDGYRDIIRSVAVISQGGGTFCTGFLVNNVNNDCAPFFMTANHCGINSANDAASLVAYWNFESPVCRQPNTTASGGNGNGQLNDFNTGAIHRASYGPSDFSLVEFDDPVSETANAFFAGWSTEYVMPQDTIICIHHPSTDEKRISFEFEPGQPGNGLNSNITTIDNATHIIVPDWDIGTTEGGSSGSPLFNNQKQVVGQLHGGAAACGNDLYDTYGWFHTSWEGGGTPSTALRFWLDPNNTGITNIGGKDCSFSVSVADSNVEVCAPEDAVYDLSPSENFVGAVTFSINNLPTNATASFDENPVDPMSVILTITTNGVASGLYPMEIIATDGVEEGSSTIVMKVEESAPASVALEMPGDMMVEVSTAPTYSWDATPTESTYQLQVASDPAFTNIVDMANDLEQATFTGSFLEILTTYYWRVRATNICGQGPWSPTWSFTTAEISCGAIQATDTPVGIGTDANITISSSITMTSNMTLTSVIVRDLDISHTYVGDLSAILTSPSGTSVQLFDRPGVPDSQFGCDGSDFFVTFADNAASTAEDLENACDDTPAIGGTYQPIESLSAFIGESTMGTWTLSVTDGAGSDGGALNDWKLDICTVESVDISLSPSQNNFEVCTEEEVSFTLTVGDDFDASGVSLTATGNPAASIVTFSNNPAMPGETVTVTISNLTIAGSFTISIEGDDGANNVATAISLATESAPVAGALNNPSNNATGVTLTPTLEWEQVGNADNYTVDVATDDAFVNIALSTTTTTGDFPISLPLEYNTTYFWRVIAENECGAIVSPTSNFTTEINVAVDELEGNSFELLPNPTKGGVNIIFAQAMEKELTVEVYSIDGQLLQQEFYNNALYTVPVHLDYSNGVYVIRLVTSKAAVARRVLLQK